MMTILRIGMVGAEGLNMVELGSKWFGRFRSNPWVLELVLAVVNSLHSGQDIRRNWVFHPVATDIVRISDIVDLYCRCYYVRE